MSYPISAINEEINTFMENYERENRSEDGDNTELYAFLDGVEQAREIIQKYA